MNEIIDAWQSVDGWVHGETDGGDKERGQPFEDPARASRPPNKEVSIPRRWRSHVELLVALTENTDLLKWLIKIRSRGEFDQLLNVRCSRTSFVDCIT